MDRSSQEPCAADRAIDHTASASKDGRAMKAVRKTETETAKPASVYRLSDELRSYLLGQCSQLVPTDDLPAFDETMTVAIEMLKELKPQSVVEAMLVAHMFAVHELAMRCLRESSLADPATVGTQTKRAMDLLRLFSEQLTALQRIRGKGVDQRVTVEHVHLHDGARAIVGNFSGDPISEADRCHRT
jgi:hypothetical protein